MKTPRGYFGVGVEKPGKSRNLGAILRTAHAFGGSFLFTLGGRATEAEARQTDTSGAAEHIPFYAWNDMSDLRLPEDCALVGIELSEDSLHLPSFRHPRRCAYLLGPEKGSLSPEATAACDHVVAIPTSFCVNVSVACAVVLYDRLLQQGGHPDRPVMPGGPLLADVQGWVNAGSERVPFTRRRG